MHTGNPRDFSHVTDERIVALYLSGLTTSAVSKVVGMSQPSIVFRLKRAGCARRTKWERHSAYPKEEAVRLYIDEQLPSTEVARRMGVTPAAVRSSVKAAGYRMRKATDTPRRTGKDNKAWKGGRFVCRRSGYARVSNGPSSGYTLEHRFVVEQSLGRKLSRDEIVHHLNGIRDDNRLDNLTVTTRKQHEHYTYVKALQRRIRDLEALIR